MIGIFDSGVGGLSIYREIKRNFKDKKIIYLADKKYFPYGEKSDHELKEITKRNVEILLNQGAKVIVVACNSATVSVINYLRSIFDVPIVGIEPAIKQASMLTKNNQIGLIATNKTVASHQNSQLIYENQTIHKSHKEKLVEKIENAYSDITDEYLVDSVSDLVKKNVDVIVLGCTHYHFVKERFEKFFPEITFLAPDQAVAKRVVDIVEQNKLQFDTGSDVFLVSGELKSFIISLNTLLGESDWDVRRI